MNQNWDWVGIVFLGMFALGALIIFIALILTVIWFMLPGSRKHHHHN